MKYALKLHYFPRGSRGEAIRTLLRHANVPFENVIIDRSNFPKVKHRYPTGKLPAMDIDGTFYPESGSLLRFAGQLTHTTPKDPIRLLIADAAYEIVRGMHVIDPILIRLEGSVLKESRRQYFHELPEKLKQLSEMLGGDDYYGGASPCFADFGVWHYLDHTTAVQPGSIEAVNIKEWMQRMASTPSTIDYLKHRPEIPETRRRIIASLQS